MHILKNFTVLSHMYIYVVLSMDEMHNLSQHTSLALHITCLRSINFYRKAVAACFQGYLIFNSGFVIRAESMVVQRTTTFSRCGCPPKFLVVHMPLLMAAPS